MVYNQMIQTHLLLQTFTIFYFLLFLQSFLSNYRTCHWSFNFSLSSVCTYMYLLSSTYIVCISYGTVVRDFESEAKTR